MQKYTELGHRIDTEEYGIPGVEVTIPCHHLEEVWLTLRDLEDMLEELKKAKEDV